MTRSSNPRLPPPLLSASASGKIPVRVLDIEQTVSRVDNRISKRTCQEKETPQEIVPANDGNDIIRNTDDRRKGSQIQCRVPCGGTLVKIALFYGLVVTALGGYLLKHFFRIPSLQNEIDQLTDQVNRLKNEISRLHNEIKTLTAEIDRLEQVNGQLNANTINLQHEVNITEANLAVFNASINTYESSLAALKYQNTLWREDNFKLNNSVTTLSGLNDRLRESIFVLNSSVLDYEAQQKIFSQEIFNLTILTEEMNQSIISLNSEVLLYKHENVRLENLVHQLQIIVNTTQSTLNWTSSVYTALIDDIAVNRNILLQRLNSEYRTLLEKWDCDIVGRYALQNFMMNETLPIGSTSFPGVFNFLYTKVLGYLCINTTDFQAFMVSMVLPPGSNIYDANILNLKESVMRYSAYLLSYYFPSGGPGLTANDWDVANYRCYNLSSSQRFVYSKILPQYYPSANVSQCSMQTTKFCIY